MADINEDPLLVEKLAILDAAESRVTEKLLALSETATEAEVKLAICEGFIAGLQDFLHAEAARRCPRPQP